ncbi:MAG: magnesium/cobalt transporter CorA [Alphaproteobacteria bacterium]|nr:magnesium/cobalt transporter CorA [Alphaproteobacteria bacterium]
MSLSSTNNRRRARKRSLRKGLPPGVPVYTGDVAGVPVNVAVIDYGTEGVEELTASSTDALQRFQHENTVTWINLDGIHDVENVKALGTAFGLHGLWLEDITNPATRSKAEVMNDRILVTCKAFSVVDGDVTAEQISIAAGKGWVLTFQERPGDVWDPLRQRIRSGGGRIRRMGSDYLLHALLDGIVDHYFVAIETFEAVVDGMEAEALEPTRAVELKQIFVLKNELAELRRAVWPMREAVSTVMRADSGQIGEDVIPYYRDLYDHVVQVMDMLETSRERVVGVYELHLAVTSMRLNDIMKFLTIVSTIFIPMTFIAGVYGMNFKDMPELQWSWGYPFAWALMLGSAAACVAFLVSRRWI